jgi:hypothetical protein
LTRFCAVLPFDYSSFFFWRGMIIEHCVTRKKVEVVSHLVGRMGGLCRRRTLRVLSLPSSQLRNFKKRNDFPGWMNGLFGKGNTFKHLEGKEKLGKYRTETGTTLGTYYMAINLHT